jgi:hypothetical protein
MGLCDLASVPKVDVVGPTGLMHLLASYRTFLYRCASKFYFFPLKKSYAYTLLFFL